LLSRLRHFSDAADVSQGFRIFLWDMTCEFARLMDGGEGDITIPVPAFLTEHPKGRGLFDTGLHPECQGEPLGDGSVTCLPTPGHTPGHQSLRLKLAGGEMVLAADACNFCRTLRERRLPRYVDDRDAMLASLNRLDALERGGARIVFGHAPAFWSTVAQSPKVVDL